MAQETNTAPRLIKFLLLSALLLLLAIYTFYQHTPENILFTDDIATAFAVSEGALSGEMPLLGPASHLGGRHLGPSYFWFLSLVLIAVGANSYFVVLALSALKLIAVIFPGYFLSKVLRKPAGEWIFVAFLLSLLGSNHIEQLRLPWSANYILVPSALTLVACLLCLLKKNLASFLFFLISASLLVQVHLGGIPFVIGLFLVIVVALIKVGSKAQFYDSNKFLNLFLIVCFFLIWLPSLLYEFSYSSNLLNIFEAHLKGEHVGAGINQSISVLLDFFVRQTGYYLPIWESFSINVQIGIKIILALSIIWLTISFYRITFTEMRFFIVALLIGSLFLAISLGSAEAPIHHYYFNTIASVPALLLALIVAYAITLIITDGTNSLSITQFVNKLSASVLIILLSSSSLYGSYKNLKRFLDRAFPIEQSLLHAQELNKIINEDNSSKESIRFFSRGKRAAGRNPVYYFLGSEYKPYMQQASYFKELPSFNKKNKTSADVAYAEVCPRYKNKTVLERHPKLKNNWQIEREILIGSCKTCKGCQLVRLVKN